MPIENPARLYCCRHRRPSTPDVASPTMIASTTAATSHFCQPGVAQLAESDPDRVEHTGLGFGDVPRHVHEPPDDPGADERDRHRAGRSSTWRRSRPWPGRPARRRQARTPWPAIVTTMTHHMLLTIVPRNVPQHGAGGEEEGDEQDDDRARLGGERAASSAPADEADDDADDRRRRRRPTTADCRRCCPVPVLGRRRTSGRS